MTLDWSDPREIAIALADAHEDMDTGQVMYVRFTDLLAMIMALEGFTGDAADCSEGRLESVQAVWLEEIEE
jgi:FeS assembly protein IscX